MYVRWKRLLPSWIHVHPVELPGRGVRLGESFVESYPALIRQLMAEQRKAMQGRYVLLGHSMGALLAYGMAQACRANGQPVPLAVFASGSPAPSKRSDGEFVAKDDDDGLIAEMRKQGGTTEEIFENEEMLRITLDTLGSDYRVCESFSYLPNMPLSVPLHVFAGKKDDVREDQINGWSVETTNQFTVDWFNGGHFFIKFDERAVLDALCARLLASSKMQAVA